MAAIIPVLAEIITDAEVTDVAGEAFIDAGTGAEIDGATDLLADGADSNGEVKLEPIFDSGTSTDPGDIPGPGDIGQLTKGQFNALWQDGKTFARWTGQEIMKGAVFQEALNVVQDQLQRDADSGFDYSTEINVIGSIVAVVKLVTVITCDWRQWTVENFYNRETFGKISTDGVIITRFEIFRTRLADLNTYLTETLALLLAEASKNINDTNIGALRSAVKTYTDQVQDISDEIPQSFPLMVHAKLNDHQSDIVQAEALIA